MTKIYIQHEKYQQFGYLDEVILQLHKRVNEEKELVCYYVKVIHNAKPARDFTFEYAAGDLIVTRGKVSAKERDLLIR